MDTKLLPLFTLAVAASFPQLAAAQTCGVRNGFRLANSHSGMPSELAVDTGWQSTAPLVTPGFNSNPGPTCSSQGSCTPTSDYGFLRCTGSGTGTNGPSSGTFLYLDQAPQARFQDTLTVVSSTLPLGTPVQLRLVVALDGFAQLIDTWPSVSFGATFNASSLSLAISNAPGTQAGVLNFQVGSSLLVQGNLAVALYPYGLLGLGIPPVTSTYNLDLTARFGIACLTPGASLTFCSGATYAPLAAEVLPVGGGCGPGSPTMSATAPVLGQVQNYTLTGAPPTQPVFFAFALGNAVSVPVGTCLVTEDPANAVLLLVGATDGAGSCGFGLGMPGAPGLVGARFTAQALVLSPGGPMLGFAQLSNGLQVTLGI